MTDIKGRTAFITGGANGIGLGIARSMARAGAKLALVDLDGDALSRAKAELETVTQVEIHRLDVRDRDAYTRTADAVERALGPVSLLFNNAGVAGGAAAEKITYEMWDWHLGINLLGVINGIQTFLPRMMSVGGGAHIVNTASGAGLASGPGSSVLYATAKYGVVGLSESLHLELAPKGVCVSVLCPGPVGTNIMQRSSAAAPAPSKPLTAEQEQRRVERVSLITQQLHQFGVSIDQAGEMVLEGVKQNRLYIHTDRMMEEGIKARAKALIEAMPNP
jgi:NAD(P)-dependent dehydrogenase (short-subunit alcohol dehydrogenase family)